MPSALADNFYVRRTQDVARDLIGCLLVSCLGNARTAGIIVETEAYLPCSDSACHAARGMTRKNASMFGPPGRAYVYPIHAKVCFNVVTEGEGTPAAVLIRSLWPIAGIERMTSRRQTSGPALLASGPARLCQALGIHRDLDGWDLTLGRRLWIEPPDSQLVKRVRLRTTRRIGVTSAHHLPLRFVWRDSPWASGPASMR